MRVLQRRPTNLVDVWEQEVYGRVLTLPWGPVVIRVSNDGTIDAPDLRLSVHPEGLALGVRAQAVGVVREVLGLDVDPAGLEEATRGEESLRATARALRGIRPPRFASLFETFANVVPFQQLSLDAGAAIVRRLVQRFGNRVEIGGRAFYSFPAAEAVVAASPPSLRACGMSRRKADTLVGLARRIVSGELNGATLSTMTTQKALTYLASLPGIGPWSAGLVLLRGLGRLDVFPPGDVGAARGLGSLLGRGHEARLRVAVERAAEHRGYLYFCALGSRLLDRGLIRPAMPLHARPT